MFKIKSFNKQMFLKQFCYGTDMYINWLLYNRDVVIRNK